MRSLLVVFSVVLLVAVGVHTQDVEGIPNQVCGSQSFATSYSSDSSVTFQVSSASSGATVSPNTVTYSNGNTQELTVTCQSTGAVEINFLSSGRNLNLAARLYCSGRKVISQYKLLIKNRSDNGIECANECRARQRI